MVTYIIKLILVLLVSVGVIGKYYDQSIHIESTKGIWSYLFFVFLIYAIYKVINLVSSKNKTIKFTPIGLFGFTMLNVFILCITVFSGSSTGGAGSLFASIVGYMFFPFVITLFSYSSGRKALSFLKSFESQTKGFQFLISLGLGFVIYISLLSTFSFIGQYNLSVVFGILFIMLVLAYDEIYKSILSFIRPIAEYENHSFSGNLFSAINFKLISAELSFILLTFLIGVNFINIIRPMPIGWDDLGVYMNYPQIMANSGKALSGAGMVAWQTFTGVGFMFHSAPQAFFFNQVGGILSIIVLIFVFSELLSESKKSHLSLPIILAAMFYGMPMIIFQQAKDMKLDPGLFFVTVIGMYGIFHLFSRYLGSEEYEATNIEGIIENPKSSASLFFKKISSVFKSESGEKNIFDNKDYLIYLLVFGAIVGLAFAIKFTTLMVILGLIGIIFYAKLGFSGFLGYFFAFLGVFTIGRLWDQMNVSYPKDDPTGVTNAGILFLVISIIIFGYSIYKYKFESIKKALIILGVFVIGVALPLVPWVTKNIIEASGDKITTGIILGGKFKGFSPDLKQIYTQKELDDIENKVKSENINKEGKASNEDLGRYFGYENGINNFLKLPLNLTFQTNQPGEYTEITYFFLALLPIMLVFLSFRSPNGFVGVGIATLVGVLYFSGFGPGKQIDNFFGNLLLPYGYIYIVGIFLATLAYFLYTLSKDRLSQIAKMNFVFITIYVLLFVVAAYGIVWYGIAMYFSFLLLIGIAGVYMSRESLDEDENLLRLFGSILLFIIIGIYFMRSSLPHGYNNLTSSGFPEFKGGLITQETGIFSSHPDYFIVLGNVNLKDQKAYAKTVYSKIQNPVIKKFVDINLGNNYDIFSLESMLRELGKSDLSKFQLDAQTIMSVKTDSTDLMNEIYKTVLYPPKELQNTGNIYRIGTFLTYFISENRDRFYDDSLVMNFGKYFYDKDPNVAISKMEKLGIKYFLVDLNAATIDKDPRHDLTKRFENLLSTFRSDKLELVQTDSPCLRIAIEEKNDTFLEMAGVNYESYTASGQVVGRQIKQMGCYNHILGLIKNGKIDEAHYSYLLPLAKYLKQNNIQDQEKLVEVFQQYIGHGWLVLFKIK